MWNLLQIAVSRLQGQSQRLEIVQRVVDRGFERTWKRVSQRILELTPAEARGYIRARSEDILRASVLAELGADGTSWAYAPAMKVTIDRVMDRAYDLRKESVLRRAA